MYSSDSSSSKKSSTSLKPVDSKVDTVVKTTNYSTPPICKRSLTQSPDLTKAPKKAKVEENEETYSPKRIGGKLTLSEIAVVKLLIETSIASPGEAFLTKNPKSRSEEIFAYIEKLVAAGAKARCNERKEIIEAYLHPQMQRCIRLEVSLPFYLFNRYYITLPFQVSKTGFVFFLFIAPEEMRGKHGYN